MMVSAFHEMIWMFFWSFLHSSRLWKHRNVLEDGRITTTTVTYWAPSAKPRGAPRRGPAERGQTEQTLHNNNQAVTTIDTEWAQKIRNGQIIPPISEILALICCSHFLALKVKCFKLVCLCCLTALARHSQKDWNGQSNQSIQGPLFNRAEPDSQQNVMRQEIFSFSAYYTKL